MSRGRVNILIVIALAWHSSLLGGSIPLKAKLSSPSALLMNTETGAILYEKQGKTPWYPASITKIITALYALEKKGHDLDALVTASVDAVRTVPIHVRRTKAHPPYRLEYGGTHMSIQKGETLHLRTLLYGLMLASANDAANVIAEYVSGSCQQFVDELNLYVRKLGCEDTLLLTPHGLPHLHHKTTAYDMAKLMQVALRLPFFRSLIQTHSYPRYANKDHPESRLVQHNALMRPGAFYYPKAIGGKTGWTEWGGHTLVVAAEDEHRKLIAVLLGCEKRQQLFQDAITLFDAAFEEKKISRTLLSREFEHFHTDLIGAHCRLDAILQENLILSYYPSEEPVINIQTVWNTPPLPISAGEIVGTLIAKSHLGTILTQASLIAEHNVDITWQHQLYQAYLLLHKTCTKQMPILLALLGALLLSLTFYLFHIRPLS